MKKALARLSAPESSSVSVYRQRILLSRSRLGRQINLDSLQSRFCGHVIGSPFGSNSELIVVPGTSQPAGGSPQRTSASVNSRAYSQCESSKPRSFHPSRLGVIQDSHPVSCGVELALQAVKSWSDWSRTICPPKQSFQFSGP